METRGGPGSGHHGHRGIPGQRGGSLPRAAGTHLGGIGVPDFSDNSKKTYISQRYAQIDDHTVVALVYLRRMEVFKNKPYRLESRWYVRNQKGKATDAQIKVGESMLKELIDSTLTVMKATGWQKALRDSNLWLAPWGAGMLKEAKLVQRDGVVVRGGPGSGHFGHAGRPGEVGGSLPEGQGGRRARPTGGPARSRHPVGVTPVSELDEVDGARSEMLMSEPTQRADDTVFGLAYTEAAWTDLSADIMDNYPPEIQQAMAEAEEKIRNGEQTINKYRDPETGEWQPERQRLHERIIEQIMSEAGETEGEGAPQIWITGGLPGAGKSTVLKERGEALPAGVHIDSDRIKTMIPEYEGWNAALVHEESSAIVQELFRRATNDGHNIIYDATLKTTSKAEALIQGFQDRGYEVNVVYVDIPMADAMERAVNRFVNEGGRYVSPMYIATHDSKNLKTLATLRNMVDYWEHWDNSQPLGQPPTLLASGGQRMNE